MGGMLSDRSVPYAWDKCGHLDVIAGLRLDMIHLIRAAPTYVQTLTLTLNPKHNPKP